MRRLFLGLWLMGMMAVTQSAVSPLYAADLQEIQRRGYLIVAVKDNVRPLGFRDDRGQLAGLEIDIARRLAQEILGNPDAVELRAVSNQDRLQWLVEDEVDLVIARLTLTASRARLVDFSEPYYLDGTALLVRDASIRQIGSLHRGTIAVLSHSSTVAVVRSRLPGARLVGVDSYQEAKALLDTSQVDAFAADASVLTGWVQEFPGYFLLPGLWSGEGLCVAMPRGNAYQDLRRQVNQAIARWRHEGWLNERIQYWNLPRQQTDTHRAG